jgi:hypothetical protein
MPLLRAAMYAKGVQIYCAPTVDERETWTPKEKWYYARAHSHTIEIAGASHSVYQSHLKEVAAVIEEAAQKSQD